MVLNLVPERQAILLEDKWMLAGAAAQFAAGAEREACAKACDERAALEQAKADHALALCDQPRWAMYSNNAGQNKLMAQEIRART